MSFHVFLLLLIFATALGLQTTNVLVTENDCIFQHMLTYYKIKGSGNVESLAELFDKVTISYHSNTSHLATLSQSSHEDDDNDHRLRRGVDIRPVDHPGEVSQCGDTVLENELHKCLPGESILSKRGYNDSMAPMAIQDFEKMCPVLLYQLTMTPCMYHPHVFLAEPHADRPVSATNEKPYLAWVGGIVSVIVISLVGMGIISIIPLMKRNFYKTIIQFLVPLAVGTLVGDALLHLLPHALSEHKDLENDLTPANLHVYRASVALLGIFIFFNAERIIGVLTTFSHDKNVASATASDQTPLPDIPYQNVMKDNDSCGSCADMPVIVGHSSKEMRDMARDAHKDFHTLNRLPCTQSSEMVTAPCTDCIHSSHPVRDTYGSRNRGFEAKTSSSIHMSLLTLNMAGASETLYKSVNVDKFLPKRMKSPVEEREQNGNLETSDPQTYIHDESADGTGQLLRKGSCDGETSASTPDSLHGNSHTSKALLALKSDLDPHEEEEHHGHSHEVPKSCTSVTYMVMMGDGIHNFTDGLAIGAAFGSSFTGGLSTSIAVLCHELPHELGDFAMLLKSGMTVRQAYLCNLLSASLQMVGCLIGVAVGNSATTSQWLFAFAGGIFMYIGLVDMLPEVNKVDKNRVWKQLLLQNLGLLTGFGLMFLIAIYEREIEALFGNEDHEH